MVDSLSRRISVGQQPAAGNIEALVQLPASVHPLSDLLVLGLLKSALSG